MIWLKKHPRLGNPLVDQAREFNGMVCVFWVAGGSKVNLSGMVSSLVGSSTTFYMFGRISIDPSNLWVLGQGFLLGLGYLGYLGSAARGKNSPYSTLRDVCCIVHTVHQMSHSGGSNQQKVSEMLLTSMSNHTRMLFEDDFSGGFFVRFPQGMKHNGCSGGENQQD